MTGHLIYRNAVGLTREGVETFKKEAAEVEEAPSSTSGVLDKLKADRAWYHHCSLSL